MTSQLQPKPGEGSGPLWTDLVWTDLIGRCRVIRARTDALEGGIRVPGELASAGYDGPGWNREPVIAVPDWQSRRGHPWEDRSQIVLANLQDLDGSDSPLCSRSALHRVLGRIADAGYEVRAAAELEFFLLNATTGLPLYREIQNYSITKGADLEPLLGPVREDLERMSIPIEAVNPEYAGGQVELNIRYGPALAAADATVLVRHFVRELARAHGLDATFLAKPWTDQAGSGMHIHQSLWQGEDNVMHDRGELSGVGRSYLAGLLLHMRELALLGSPTPNSYHRRADYSFAPTVVAWGVDNRTVAVRAIVESPAGTRVEHRDASADCNIYLAMAGQFASGFRGVGDELRPPDPVAGDAYLREDLEKLPRSFQEAYGLLNASGLAREALGETVSCLLTALEPELTIAVISSSDWERDRYLHVM